MELEEILEHFEKVKYLKEGDEVHMAMAPYCLEALQITAELNGSFHTMPEIRDMFSRLTGKGIDESFAIFLPFNADFGKNLTIGKNVFINSGCKFQDQGGITIGDGSLIGHNVVMATVNHGLSRETRHYNYFSPITIGENVWIGANATILPGVTIGDYAVVAAGAVVTKDVEAGVVVGGVPARFIRNIEEDE